MWQNQGGGFNQSGYGDQGGGGGYMSPGGFGTPQQSQERKSRTRAQNIMPSTVAQVLNADQTDDKFYQGDVELSQVTIVGLVRTVKESPTRIDYEIDDMTGPPLEVKQFVDNDENLPEEERVQAMRENTYVRVYGHLRSFAGKRSVVAFKMTPLTDMNELSCHMLEVIHSHVTLSSGQGAGGGAMASVNSGAGFSDMGSGGGGSSTIPGLSPLQSQIQLIIKNHPSDTGASIDAVCKQLRNVPEQQIREAVDFLSGEGHIYSTIDEDHYKATDG
ncbi:replication protein A 32 kDa subunit-like [Haliotis cracherodii]|uniref:replication protein A 32 kDa subunit-like n=1 Tax=Haliotis cracherodii TaxID=6455 RepID=UPI0039E8E957